MEDKNDGAKVVEVLDELSSSIEEDDKKWIICISLCILAGDQVHPYVSDLDETAANYLTNLFSDNNVDTYWQHQDPKKQHGILYGLLYLIGSNSKELVRVAAHASLRRLLLSEIKAKRTEYSFPLICVMKNVEKAKGEFKNMTERWLSQRDVRLKLDSFVQGLSLLVSLMEMELDQAAGNDTNDTDAVLHTCRLIGYFILVNDHEPKLLLSFMMEKLDPTLGRAKYDDGLWNRLKTLVNLISSNNVLLKLEGVVQGLTPEKVVACFGKYSENKKLIICAILIRCVLLDTPYGGELNMMILAIERDFRDARFWGENSCLVDQLRLILNEQRKLGLSLNKKIKASLETIYGVASKLDRFGLVKSDEGLATNVEVLIKKLLKCLSDPKISDDAMVVVLRCLKIYLNRQLYPLPHLDYDGVGGKLSNVWFAHDELAQLLGELRDNVNAIIEERRRTR